VLASLPFLFGGLLTTVWITAAASALALALAFPIGTLRCAGGRLLNLLLGSFVELFRGTSLLLQLFWLFYVLPLVGIELSPAVAAILGIGLNYGAYGSEVIRGSFAAVGKSQGEAARSLGLTPWMSYRLVLIPQVLPVVIAPLGVLTVQLLKATSLASLITISDLSFRAYQLNQVTARTGPIFGIVLLLYFLCAQTISNMVNWADRAVGGWRRCQSRPIERRCRVEAVLSSGEV
jgi:polar amino acid transport system permease protein